MKQTESYNVLHLLDLYLIKGRKSVVVVLKNTSDEINRLDSMFNSNIHCMGIKYKF